MTTHFLKTVPPWFAAVWDGTKRFEVRVNDRGFAVGDTLWLCEWVPCESGGDFRYSGRRIRCKVTCIVRWREVDGIEFGHVAMGIRVLRRDDGHHHQRPQKGKRPWQPKKTTTTRTSRP